MMDKVRMDRTGKKKQAPAVKAKKYLPKWYVTKRSVFRS
jgi:hypothetical protein